MNCWWCVTHCTREPAACPGLSSVSGVWSQQRRPSPKLRSSCQKREQPQKCASPACPKQWPSIQSGEATCRRGVRGAHPAGPGPQVLPCCRHLGARGGHARHCRAPADSSRSTGAQRSQGWPPRLQQKRPPPPTCRHKMAGQRRRCSPEAISSSGPGRGSSAGHLARHAHWMKAGTARHAICAQRDWVLTCYCPSSGPGLSCSGRHLKCIWSLTIHWRLKLA